ncbi:MAG: hypothetical protein A3F43_00210 [Gammaproteobacteria bacterium RIFCSPHIGHO2_12_FULL_42_10]|nr:MAG: hypothetical protein A3F43_00210 [Gammaproteobacteria bacterium RIFCSPHIGHO2_12_FULL_42_10]
MFVNCFKSRFFAIPKLTIAINAARIARIQPPIQQRPPKNVSMSTLFAYRPTHLITFSASHKLTPAEKMWQECIEFGEPSKRPRRP